MIYELAIHKVGMILIMFPFWTWIFCYVYQFFHLRTTEELKAFLLKYTL